MHEEQEPWFGIDMGTYRYAPLNEDRNEIRLLTLLAGSFTDEIIIRLDNVSFTADEASVMPKYEALSYTWGTSHHSVDLIVSTGSPKVKTAHSGRLNVWKNLAIALPYLRYEKKDRCLWIDALCINQEDINERSCQVQKMGDIYSHAERVLAWLGPEEENSSHAMKTLESLASRIVVDWSTQDIQPVSDEYHDSADLSTILPLNNFDWKAVDLLCSREWFERLWIRQEIWLAKKAYLICGKSVLPWESFRKAIFCIYQKPRSYEVPSFWDRMELLDTLVNKEPEQSLAYTIYLSRHSKCFDPRDRVYAMLGLINEDKNEWAVTPDYSQTVCQVYKNVAHSYIDAFLDLNFLRYCDIGARECGPDLPSWAPDWRCLNTCAPSLPTYTAHADASAKMWLEEDTLHALGLRIGSVKMVTEIKVDNNTPYDDAVLDIQQFAKPHMPGSDEPNYQTHLSALCRTLVADEFGDRSEPPSSYITEKNAQVAFSKIWTSTRATFNDALNNEQDIRLYLNKVGWNCTWRALISTSNGLLGLAPMSTKVDDIVCVVLGCATPLVLRPNTSNPRVFEIVGECYVDSIMRGEAFLGPLPSGIRTVKKFDEDLGYDRQGFFDRRSGKVQFVDPRYTGFLGEGFEDRLDFEECDGNEDENREKVMEVMKVREIELDSFEIV